MATILPTPANHFFSESNTSQPLYLLNRCSNMDELKQIHAQMFKQGLAADIIPVSRILAFCTTPISGNLAYAQMVFDRISRPNTFMWNTMVRGYTDSDTPEQALLLYQQMLSSAVQHNAYTFPFLLKACSSLSALEETQQIHAQIIKLGFGSEVFATNSLLHVYAVSGSIKSAHILFDRIPQRDIVSWNSMIDGYAKCGEMEMAYEMFKNMKEKNVISWTTMISGYVGTGMNKEALNLFHKMQIAGVKPDSVALTCMQSVATWRKLWKYLGEQRKKGVSAWTAIIFGFAIHGHGKEALNWFLAMQKAGIKPNLITFTAILTACSYAGLVDEGKSWFESMGRKYNLKPRVEHYGCMVDLLGRAGLLKEAKELIDTMPVRPNSVIWGALLKACQIHRNLELGKQIGKILIEADTDHGGRYIHLASIYAMAREWDQVVEVRKQMTDQGVSKLPGRSSISLNGVVHEFLAGDRSHPEMNKIIHSWDQIAERLKHEGYKPELKDLLLDLEDDEKETAINQHSEKLAIAFGLIRAEPSATIRIIKNLRVCEDCHTVMKLISKIYDREIVMRDRARFHLFKNGRCTCEDYW
ncbi:Pentatricopeptide repeat [Melia azedarach]|uniref:Pentatricopeptide repeat n=1 Tax=Melia azedarach TaxID=155640 RepID=A0ACC1XSH0_MELAZ|nr:Pentatricopeptide repeat [Melia azedarach]